MANKALKRSKWLRYGLLLIAISLFLATSLQQYNTFDAHNTVKRLSEEQKLVLLQKWDMLLEHCEGVLETKCRALQKHENVDFSKHSFDRFSLQALRKPTKPQNAQNLISQQLHKLNRPIGFEHLKITYTTQLSQATQSWLTQNPNISLSLVIPSLKTPEIRLTSPITSTWIDPRGADMHVSLPFTDIQGLYEKVSMEMILPIHTLQEEISHPFPPVIIHSKHIKEYTEIDNLIELSKIYNYYLLITLALIISILSLIMDHVKMIRFVSYFFCATTARALSNLFLDSPSLAMYQQYLLILLNSLICLLYTGLAHHFTDNAHSFLRPRNILWLGILVCINYMIFELTTLHISLWNDATGAICACLIIIGNVLAKTFKDKQKIHKTLLVTSSIFGLYAVAKLTDIFTDFDALTSLFQWIDLMFYGSLFMLSLLHVGSIATTIHKVSSMVKAKTKIDRDMAIGKELQTAILPNKKQHTAYYRWHTYAYPAKKLTGHWFDLHSINHKNHHLLMGCMACVHGEGIAASMMTTNIASHWRLWCIEMEEKMVQNIPLDHNNELGIVTTQFHKALIGFSHRLTCSMKGFIYHPQKRKLFYISAAGGGIILTQDHSLKILSTKNPPPGSPSSDDHPWKSDAIQLDEKAHHIFMYTDSLTDHHSYHWINNIEWQSEQDGRMAASYLTEALRTKRKYYHSHPDKVEDLALLALRVEKG